MGDGDRNRPGCGAFGRDETVEPDDVLGHAVGRVLHDGAGVDVELDVGAVGLGQALDQDGPAALEQGQPGLGGQVPGEGETEAEAAGVIDGAALGQQLRRRAAGPASVIR